MFEDNEVVFRVIRKGRSTNLRHVSRYHRFDLDWLLRRIKLSPSISIRYVRTTEHSADMCVDQGCVHNHSMEVSDAVLRHPSAM